MQLSKQTPVGRFPWLAQKSSRQRFTKLSYPLVEICLFVVYFDQLLGAPVPKKLVKISCYYLYCFFNCCKSRLYEPSHHGKKKTALLILFYIFGHCSHFYYGAKASLFWLLPVCLLGFGHCPSHIVLGIALTFTMEHGPCSILLILTLVNFSPEVGK